MAVETGLARKRFMEMIYDTWVFEFWVKNSSIFVAWFQKTLQVDSFVFSAQTALPQCTVTFSFVKACGVLKSIKHNAQSRTVTALVLERWPCWLGC